MTAQPQQPSMFGQMAATAGGVAVGSAVVCIMLLRKQMSIFGLHINMVLRKIFIRNIDFVTIRKIAICLVFSNTKMARSQINGSFHM